MRGDGPPVRSKATACFARRRCRLHKARVAGSVSPLPSWSSITAAGCDATPDTRSIRASASLREGIRNVWSGSKAMTRPSASARTPRPRAQCGASIHSPVQETQTKMPATTSGGSTMRQARSKRIIARARAASRSRRGFAIASPLGESSGRIDFQRPSFSKTISQTIIASRGSACGLFTQVLSHDLLKTVCNYSEDHALSVAI